MLMDTLIVEDEPFVRKDLSGLLIQHKDIRVAGEAATVAEARKQLRRHFFDLIFLDIHLRGGSGFDLVPFIDERSDIVFVTGYDEYAIKAFEINALDYLLKPVSRDRLANTLRRVAKKKDRQLEVDRGQVLVKSDMGAQYVRFKDIFAVSTIGGNYLNLYLRGGEKILCRSTIRFWSSRLPREIFMRIHRSTIINIKQIRAVVPEKGGVLKIRLKSSPGWFTVSRRTSSALKRMLNSKDAATG